MDDGALLVVVDIASATSGLVAGGIGVEKLVDDKGTGVGLASEVGGKKAGVVGGMVVLFERGN